MPHAIQDEIPDQVHTSVRRRSPQRFGLAIAIALLGCVLIPLSAQAQSAPPRRSLRTLPPFSLQQIETGFCPGNIPGVRDRIDFRPNLSLPSLWLARDQFAARAKFGSKLLEAWLACPQHEQDPAQVNVVINQQLWSLLDYLERYQFLNEFGSAARKEGYDLTLYNQQGSKMAAYSCTASIAAASSASLSAQAVSGNKALADKATPDLSHADSQGDRSSSTSIAPQAAITPMPTCHLDLGSGGIRSQSSGFDGELPIGNGIGQP